MERRASSPVVRARGRPPLRYRYILIVAFALVHWQSHAQRAPLHRLYSSVQFIEEAGDLIGLELDLNSVGRSVSGELRNYQGACGIPTQVTGILDGKRLTLHGVNEFYGDVNLDGTLSGKTAKLTVKFGKGPSEAVVLKPTAKAHCRETPSK